MNFLIGYFRQQYPWCCGSLLLQVAQVYHHSSLYPYGIIYDDINQGISIIFEVIHYHAYVIFCFFLFS